MPTPLVVTDEDPVALNGAIDGSGNLQISHDSDSLADHEQKLEAVHDDLRSPSGEIRIKLVDFHSGGHTWQMNASHYDGGTVNWTRSTGHAYCDFTEMATFLEIAVVATSNASTPVNKPRTIWIKTSPTDGRPE